MMNGLQLKLCRQPAFAGMFYPEEENRLRSLVTGFVNNAGHPVPELPKAIIAPHAGYIYSGPVAGSSFARLRHKRNGIRRVVLLGPSHRVAFDGIALSAAAGFVTPLG